MKLSVCLIVKDEEEVLARCLSCITPFADEIIVVDTGSLDNTINIAKSFNAKVFSFPWQDDFASARNFSFSKAQCELVMWLDADDVITQENANKIKQLKDKDFDVAFLNYCAAFDNGKPTFIYSRERIFKKSCNFKWQGAVHEVITPRGKIVYSNAEIHHKKNKKGDPMRNLKIYEKQIARGICFNEREKFYYGRELYFNKFYERSAEVLKEFLQGDGWVQNKVEASLTLYDIYKYLKDEKTALYFLLQSLLYTPPNSRLCCILGEHFLNKKQFESAIYWYENAINNNVSTKSGAFINLDYCAYVPYMQLCVIYDKLKDFKRAEEYNDLAYSVKPNDKNVLLNKRYFSTLKKQGNKND